MGDSLVDTKPQRAMTNYDVFVALSERHDKSDELAASRHLALVTEIEEIKGTLRVHDTRIAAVERRDAPRSHAIALFAIALAAWTLVAVVLLHAAPALAR